MNRFYDIPFIPSRELLPWESAKRGLDVQIGQFENMERWRFRSDIAGGDIWIESGEVSDLASIPSIIEWAAMPSDDQRIAGGAWVHDKLFRAGGKILVTTPSGIIGTVALSFAECNAILVDEAMPDLGASKFDRWKVLTGLRIGGRRNFKN